ncbi:MAG: HlyD family secretion protein [Cyanobacteria bacterium]|nr:HlyD family secretion protein [Cyanobacteriota bacterium]
MKKNQLLDPSVRSIRTQSDPAIDVVESLSKESEALVELSPSNQSPSDQSVADPSPSDQSVADPSPSPLAKQRLPLIFGGLILVIVGAVFGGRWWQFQQTHAETDNAQIQGHLSPIAARISATVQKVLVKEGDHVEAGQDLVILEDQDLSLKVQMAQAQLANAKAQLAGAQDTVRITNQTTPTQVAQSQAKLAASMAGINAAEAGVAQAEAQIATRQAAITQAQTALNKAAADYRRYNSLYKEGAVSAQQNDTARAAYENAQASLVASTQIVQESEAGLVTAKAQLQTSQANANAASGQVKETQISGQNVTVQQSQQKQAQAQIAQAEATLALAKQQITYTVIKAPVTGDVGQLTAQVGQKIQTGQPLLSIVPLQTDTVYVEANFKETALGRLKVGNLATVKVDAYPNETFVAHVAGISPATGSSYALLPPDNATGNFNKVVQWVPVRLVFDPQADPRHKLRPGLNVSVSVETLRVDTASVEAIDKPPSIQSTSTLKP